MLLTGPSVSQLVSQSFLFFCQRNSSETALQNFMKLCSYKEQDIRRNYNSIFFLGVTPLLKFCPKNSAEAVC